MSHQISLENDYLGPRRVETLKKEDFDWQKKAQEAVLNIQEFTVKYFEITAKAQRGVYERMKVDQRKFGKSSWTAAVERMERLRYSVAKETLQLQRAREICLDQRKHALREQMQSLCSGEDAMVLLDLMESQYYELQLQLYDIQAEILQCEELLLTAQLASVHRQMTDRQDEVVYYDAFESADDITVDDSAEREELLRLQASARQLEARRGRVVAKRSYLRNKREVCVSNHTQKQQKQGSASPQLPQVGRVGYRHLTVGSAGLCVCVLRGCVCVFCVVVCLCAHSCHRSKLLQLRNEEEDEAVKNSRVSQERQRTLDRLRTFKQRYPGQVILKSTRLRSTHTRRAERTNAAEDVPLSPLGPFIPRFFDSSQLVSARQKLRKTPEFDPNSRRVSSPMDEVLASLKRGSFHLRKVEQRSPRPARGEDDPNSILVQIRKGVKLRRVPRKEKKAQAHPASADPLTRSIHEALRRIKEVSPESDSEDEGMAGPDWDS
ncbi:unnamed protein product, partial [Tetraodon nigroviridis]